MGKFKDFVRGEITLKVESLEIEKFINIATKNKIRMWNLKRENFTTITFTINVTTPGVIFIPCNGYQFFRCLYIADLSLLHKIVKVFLYLHYKSWGWIKYIHYSH